MNGQICQSCGIPMMKREDFGTESNDDINIEYCNNCYKDGKFTNPDATVDEMIDKVAEIMAKLQNMQEYQAKTIARNYIPRLKRWQSE